jgi:hypothetical protein
MEGISAFVARVRAQKLSKDTASDYLVIFSPEYRKKHGPEGAFYVIAGNEWRATRRDNAKGDEATSAFHSGQKVDVLAYC